MNRLTLRHRLLLLTLLPSTLIAIALVTYFTLSGIQTLEGELRAKALSTVRYLAPVSEYGIIAGQIESLHGLAQATVQESGVKAAIIVSGQGVSRGWIGTDAWKNITRPMMVLTGSQDVVSVSKETPQTRRHPYEYAPDGDKYLLFIEGATHSSYQGPSQRPSVKDPPHIDKIQAIVTAGTTAFLDAYLGDGLGASERGRAYLQSDQLPRFSGGLLEYKRK